MKKIAVLGSTGSVGTQALEIVGAHPELFKVTAITANTNVELLAKQAEKFKPGFIGVSGKNSGEDIFGIKTSYGEEAILEACEYDNPDIVLLSVMGIAGLPAFVKCIKENRTVALANKEAMVCGGKIARELMYKYNANVLPVDSELSAVFQCLKGNKKDEIKNIWLTASGGPLFGKSKHEVANASVEQVLKHPNWSMGAKITVDSASMLNKGLEIMETRWLFDIPVSKIKVAVHRDSIVHSMVEYEDGCVMAQLAVPDMKLPIQYALMYPDRGASAVKPLNLFEMPALKFYPPDIESFPCLGLCYSALESHELQVVLNAANEVAVDRFLHKKISFGTIPEIIEKCMNEFSAEEIHSVEDIFSLDLSVREYIKLTYRTFF